MKLKRIVFIVVLLQLVLCTVETVRSIDCYKASLSGSECWSWFFAFIANIPASIVFERAFGAMVGQFGVEAFAARTTLRFAIYFIGGSIWWIFIVLSIGGLVRSIKKRDIIGDRP